MEQGILIELHQNLYQHLQSLSLFSVAEYSSNLLAGLFVDLLIHFILVLLRRIDDALRKSSPESELCHG